MVRKFILRPIVMTVLFSMIPFVTLLAQDSDGTSSISDLFGAQSGYIHPFISTSIASSDNINSSHSDPVSDRLTVLSPGVWFAVPASRSQLLSLNTSSYTPGGLDLTREKVDYFQRYQFYMLYSADIEKYAETESKDSLKQKLEGIFQYNFRGGLTLEFLLQGSQTRDPDFLTESTEQDNFKTGLTGLSTSYEISDMLRGRLDYSNFIVDYDTSSNSFKDRSDNVSSAYLFFVLSPKTEIFLEYETISLGYVENTLSDSEHNHVLGGLKWQATEKSMAKVKIGQGTKTFENSSLDKITATILELTANYSFTQKSSLNLMAGTKLKETPIATSAYVLNQLASVGYQQFFNPRLSGKVSLLQMQDDYKTNSITDRSDTVLMTSLSLDYTFSDWLLGALGYSGTKTDSTLDTLDSDRNDVYVRISAAF
jgi:polysaccharide biosynthesis protein VpsM